MSVFIVIETDMAEGDQIEGVFSDRKKAESLANKLFRLLKTRRFTSHQIIVIEEWKLGGTKGKVIYEKSLELGNHIVNKCLSGRGYRYATG